MKKNLIKSLNELLEAIKISEEQKNKGSKDEGRLYEKTRDDRQTYKKNHNIRIKGSEVRNVLRKRWRDKDYQK